MNPEAFAEVGVARGSVRTAWPARELARWAAAVFVGLLWLVAAVLCWRRAAGALSSALEPWALLFVGALLAATAAAARMAWRYRTAGRPAGPLDRFAAASVSVAVLAIGVELSLPGTSPGGLLVFWGILAAEQWRAWGLAGWRRLRTRWGGHAPVQREIPADLPRSSASGPIPSFPVSDTPPADAVTQQLTRSRAADGSEILRGWLRVPMAPGQRTANVHLAFCPPFPRTPRVTIGQVAGPETRIKTVQLLPYGARFDLKLATVGEGAATVLLEFSAEAAAPAGPGTDPKASDGEGSPEA